MTLEENRNRLNKLKFLKKNWNGHAADEFDKSFIDSIIKLLPSLTLQPQLFPTARDSIQFEYIINFENYPHTYVEIEIWKDFFEIFIQNDDTQFEKEISINEIISADAINEIVTGNYKGENLFD